GRLLRADDGAAGRPRAPRRAGGASLAADAPGTRGVSLFLQRSPGVARGAARVLGEPDAARRAAAPHLGRAHRRLRRVRVDGAHRTPAGAAVGLRVPAAVRSGRRSAAHALPRDVQPQGRVPRRGDSRADRDPGRLRRLGPVARAAAARGRSRPGLAVDAVPDRGRTDPRRVSGGVRDGRGEKGPLIAGHATAEGTTRYAERLQEEVPADHFRPIAGDVRAASVGIGTYLGREDAATDAAYAKAVARVLERGINVIDTAVN